MLQICFKIEHFQGEELPLKNGDITQFLGSQCVQEKFHAVVNLQRCITSHKQQKTTNMYFFP